MYTTYVMLVPGYYVTTSAKRLEHAARAAHVRVEAADWLVTDGDVIGRFDQSNTLDWLPLEWTPGKFVKVSDISQESLESLESGCRAVTYTVLNNRLAAELVIDGDPTPMPDLPKPPLARLPQYLKHSLLGFHSR